MNEVEIKRVVNVPIETAWAIWDDYGNIAKFNPLLKNSHIVEGGTDEVGLGCKRVCHLKDGKNWVKEEITIYEPYQKMQVKIYDGTMPLKEAQATIYFKKLSGAHTEVKFVMQFTPKFGLLGKLMSPMMKMQFSKMLGKMMDAFVSYAEAPLKKAA